jgi:hypothetical protein
MYTPGMIIKIGTESEKLGVVLESSGTMVKYLGLTSDMDNNKSNTAIYPLTRDVFEMSLDNKPDVIYAHLDVICIAEGEFKICGRINSNQTFVELMSYLNGYKNYSKMIKERLDVDTSNIEIVEPSISLRKTV